MEDEFVEGTFKYDEYDSEADLYDVGRKHEAVS
jgi:hypothetical protein